MHIVRVLAHIAEEVGAAQVRSEGVGTAEQAVQSDLIADFLLDATGNVDHEGEAAFVTTELLVGDDHVFFQRMRTHAGRAVLFPLDAAAHDLGFELEVEEEKEAVGAVELVDFEQAFDELVSVLIDFVGSIALEETGVHTSHGDPGGAFGFFVAQTLKEQFLRSHVLSLCLEG